ncbi:MAG: ABC transporter substrate-binding protein [Spirochaetaceae bacterium]|jgi:NitT/TauT family transport system substrate-binding protein|nr:ABC transporter substrate-binding protein [Spirochaetaceae bacterium]
MRTAQKTVRTALAVVLLSGLLGFSGCAKPSTLPTLKIGLIVQDAVRPALVVAAEELGYYKEEGVNIEFVSIDTVPSGLAAVETRKVDIFPFSANALPLLAKGSSHVIVGGVAVEGASLVASPQNVNTDFRDFSQWKGKKIGGQLTSMPQFQLFQYLREKKSDFDPDSFELINFDDNNVLLEAIKKGAVDAGFLTTERIWLAEASGCVEAFDMAEYLPYYICCRLTANIEGVKENRAAYVAVLMALLRAEHDYKEDTGKIVDAVTKYTSQKREYVVRYIATEKDYDGGGLVNFKNPVSPDPLFNKLDDLNRASIAAGVYQWTAPFALKDRVDLSIYQEALDSLLERYPDDATYKRAAALFKANNSKYGT